jgi:hypothetical protein
MYQLDASRFPIVFQTVDAQPLTVATIAHVEHSLTALFARQQAFGILAFIGDENNAKAEKAVTKASNDMFKRLKPQFTHWCVGYAGVTQSSKWLALYRPIADLAMRNRIGCPGAVFESAQQAEAWLQGKLMRF